MAKCIYVVFAIVLIVLCTGIMCLPEQGIQTLTSAQEKKEEKWTMSWNVSKSMYAGTIMAIEISCTADVESIEWSIWTFRCADSFQGFNEGDFDSKSSEGSHVLVYKEPSVKCNQGTITLSDMTAKTWLLMKRISDDSSTTNDEADGESVPAVDVSTSISSEARSTRLPPKNTKDRDRNYRGRRAVDAQGNTTQSDAIKLNSSASVPGAFAKAPVDGLYHFQMTAVLNYKPASNMTVIVKFVSSYGYLSAIDFPFLPFYAVLCAVYVFFLVTWLILCCCYCRDILRIQLWIAAVILIGFIEEATFLGEYHVINQTGQSVPGAVHFGEFISCAKRALARMLVIIASLGFGIVKPRLGPTLHKVLAVGIAYFILSAVDGYMRATTFKANHQERSEIIFIGILAVTDAAICWWIFTALIQTTRTLRLRRNLVKLSLYRHFTNTLIFAVIASVGFMLWSIIMHKFTQCLTDWKELWVEDAFWQLLFTIILLVMMILWRPSASNQRYAYSPLSDGADDDAEEPMMNEAFDGMKMRGSKSDVSNSRKHSTDQVDDDLKWIEDNIPASVADSTLPGLLDSEEEIMNTKYELSKMQ